MSILLKTQVDNYLVRRNRRYFLKDIKVLPIEECIRQLKALLCDCKYFTRGKDMETTLLKCKG